METTTMSDSPLQTEAADASGVHQPFTRAERIQQLSEIDRDITSLLTLTGTALASLKTASPSAEAQTADFKSSMDEFLSTLHSVDVRLKRQILGLEEAGIVSLPVKDPKAAPGSTNVPAASLEPNGVGNIGSLDVGWLNSRSSKVERDMEAELWTKARTHLGGGTGKEAEAGDIQMEGS